MGALDFLRRSHHVTALHYNHATPGSSQAQRCVETYCSTHKIPLLVGQLDDPPPAGDSKEDYWRQKRYEFFEASGVQTPIVTCHHLDDVAETWIFTSLHGEPRLIPARRGIYLRPFLQTRKEVFVSWCDRKGVEYVEDVSNKNTRFRRNYIRHRLMPHALEVNPGLHKVLKKKLKVGV